MPSLTLPRSFRPLSRMRSRSKMNSYDSDNDLPTSSPSSSTSSSSTSSSASSSKSSSLENLSVTNRQNPSHTSIWYHDDDLVSLSLPRRTRRLFEEYSKIPKDEVESHILQVREQAWDVHSYASIGSFRFLDGSIHWTPQFESVLARLKAKPRSRSKSRSRSSSPTTTTPTSSRPSSSHLLSSSSNSKTCSLSRPGSSHLLSPSPPPLLFSSRRDSSRGGAKLLDLGCCLGQDLRFFAHRGAPPQNLYGIDIYPEFITLGYSLFRDKSKIPPSNFFIGDVFDPTSLTNPELDHTMDIVHIGSFLHMFTWDQQVTACERIVSFLKEEEGVTVFGRHLGSTKSGVYMGRDKCWTKRNENDDVSERWRHDTESFERLWEEVGSRTGSRWKVEVDMRDFQKETGKSYGDPCLRRMMFNVTRIA